MLKLITIALLFPLITSAQINRSAAELAKETIKEYVTTKLFSDAEYKPLKFDSIRAWPERRSDIEWTIAHEFEIRRKRSSYSNEERKPELYKVLFYLDKQMKVLRSESSSRSE